MPQSERILSAVAPDGARVVLKVFGPEAVREFERELSVLAQLAPCAPRELPTLLERLMAHIQSRRHQTDTIIKSINGTIKPSPPNGRH